MMVVMLVMLVMVVVINEDVTPYAGHSMWAASPSWKLNNVPAKNLQSHCFMQNKPSTAQYFLKVLIHILTIYSPIQRLSKVDLDLCGEIWSPAGSAKVVLVRIIRLAVHLSLVLIVDFQNILRNILPEILIDWLISRCVLRFCPASSYFVSPIFPNTGQPPTSPKLSKEKPQPFSPHNSYTKSRSSWKGEKVHTEDEFSTKRLASQTQWEKTKAGFFPSQNCNIYTASPPRPPKK